MVTGKAHKPTKFTRMVIYPITGLIFFAMLAVLLTLANGYRFTYNAGKIGLVKTGMLIISTRPFDASITLNGKLHKRRTGFYLLATKISSLKPGDYFVEIQKNGYRTWRDNLEILPNIVTWANYILLFPEKLNISKVEAPVGRVISRSENGRHVIFTSDKGAFTLKSWDSNNLSIKDFWPTATPIEPWLVSPQIQSAELSPNNDLVLLRVLNGTRNEFVISDSTSNPVKLIHLNVTLKEDMSNIWWNTANNNELYVETKSGISLVRYQDTAIASPIVKNAVYFKVDESRQILYVVKNDTGTYSVDRMGLDGGNKSTLVPSIVPAKTYKLAYSTRNDILTVLNEDTGELTAYYVGNSKKKSSIKLSEAVKSFGWSKNGEYIYYYGDNFVKRYDWVKEKETETSLDIPPISVRWFFDEHHYFITNQKGIFLMDIDGSNVIPISELPVTDSILDVGTSNIIFSQTDSSGEKNYFKYISGF